MKLLFRCYLLFVIGSFAVHAQTASSQKTDVYVDKEGILRWAGSNAEVSLFGVNYTVPFAYSYRAHKKIGLSLKEAIDLDVEQMVRLGFDAYRIHVWDREISDSSGNILNNEHLDLFDYLLAKLAEHNIKSILTPIAWWGNGYPERDEIAPGFSQRYPRLELITNPKARSAERNYLTQFMTHRNPYKKIAYKDDPSIIAVEIINEPTHPENGKEVTEYINDMVNVLREAGCAKPIFYNVTISWSDVQANAVVNANVDGISFQWYPTALVHGKMLDGNYLINVDSYSVPSKNVARYKEKAKMVYEFDAADIGGSYMYPAMIRSFREAGMQFATMFSYDPSQIAWSNTEYPTHFTNLLYTPSKALSLMIAGRAFHQLPRDTSFGRYPANNRFGDFRVNYAEDLSEMNTDTEFVYSNSSSSRPKNVLSLRHVAGCGNSPIVRYDGTGAYFFDKLEPGIWTLELYPDVLWLRDPFELTNNLSKQAARLFWSERQIEIDLADLGKEYMVYPLSPAKEQTSVLRQSLKPGKYLLAAKNANTKNIDAYRSRKENFLHGLYTPQSIAPNVYGVNKTNSYAKSGDVSAFKFKIAGEQPATNAALYIRRCDSGTKFEKHPLKYIGGYDYAAADSSAILQPGNLEYYITVESGSKVYSFPGGNPYAPEKLDSSTNGCWHLIILDTAEPVVLLDAARDKKDFVFPNYDRSKKYSIDYKQGSIKEKTAIAFDVSFLSDGEVPFGFQLNTSRFVKPFAVQLETHKTVVITGRSSGDSDCMIGLNLLMEDGKCYTASVLLKKNWNEIALPLAEFKNGMSLLLPNSYPGLLSQIRQSKNDEENIIRDLHSLEGLQITVDSAGKILLDEKKEAKFEIESIVLKK